MINLNGLAFHVEVEGTGPPLLLLHGFTGSSRSWDPLHAPLDSVSTVISVDLIGHARSAAPTDPARYTLDHAARDLDALLDQLAIARASVLGYSMGGRLALHFAVQYPRRVEGLMLESASPGLEDAAERSKRAAADDALADRLEEEGLERFIAFWESQPLLEPAPHVPLDVRQQQHAIRMAHSARGLANSLRGMGTGQQAPLWSALPRLEVPTLLITGDRDARYGEIAARMQAVLPRAQQRVIVGAGHTAHVDQPAAFAAVVRAYLENSFSPRKVPNGSARPAAPTDLMHS